MKKLFGVALGILTAIGGFVDIGDLVTSGLVGARFGLSLAWATVLGLVGICLFAEMSGRIAAVTSRGTFDLVRERLGPRAALANLVASFLVTGLTFTAEIGGVALSLELASSVNYLLWAQKQYAEAIGEFEAELALDPKHTQALVYLADTRVQMNQYAEAAPLLEQAVKLDPSLGLAHLDLGIVAANDGRNDEALVEFLKAEKLNPEDVNVHWRLGRLYRTMGRKVEAKAELDKASSITRSANQELYRKIGGSQAGPPAAQPDSSESGAK